MKRSEIIKQLMNEGFSEKTLVNFSDKQLLSLSSRILSEQMTSTTPKGTSVNVNSGNPKFPDIMNKLQKQTGIKDINVTEGGVPGLKAKEVKESGVPGLKVKEVKESGVPGLKAKKSSGELKNGTAEKEMKESGVPGLTAKKSSGELKNGTAEKEMKESGVPGLTAKKSSGELKNGTAEKEMKEGRKSNAFPGMMGVMKKWNQDTKKKNENPKSDSKETDKNVKKSEVKESGVPGLTAKKSSGELKNGTSQKEMKEAAGAMPGLTVKGTTNTPTTKSTSKKETKEEDVNEKKPSAGLSKEKKSEVVKKAKKGGDIGKKGKGFEKVAAKAAKEYGSKEKGEKVAAASMWKNIKREGKNINEWVDDVANKHYHPFTSKSEIMEMISNKMDEMNEEGNKLPGFLKAKSIKSKGSDVATMDAPATPKTKPTTKPGTKPVVKPTPKTPYKPGPGVNPHPKGLKEVEEEEISESPKTNKVPVVKPGAKI